MQIQGNDSYPLYPRRDDNRYISLDSNVDKVVDNRWMVPYNHWLLLKFNCHINVEICSCVKSIKYLYKYIHKGPDCAEIELRTGQNHDEVKKYVDGRYICEPEAFWRTFKYPITRIYPTVVRLQLHLSDMHLVHYRGTERVNNIVNDERNARTKLTEFFKVYEDGREVNKYMYVEFPKYYWWDTKERTWVRRKNVRQVLGRIYVASPSEGERFFLRMLLNHVRAPKSFSDLRTINGVCYGSFREAAKKLGILEEDDRIRQCLVEARSVRMPSALRRLFATILIFCEPIGVRRLWDENYSYMTEDYPTTSCTPNAHVTNMLLHEIITVLLQHRKSVTAYELLHITQHINHVTGPSTLIDHQLSIRISQEDLESVNKLNVGQQHIFNAIMHSISARESKVFFVDGPGGIGKTFLNRALLASCRNQGLIVLATAISGITANQLPSGRTSHSKLRIPVKLNSHSLCNFSKQSDMCLLLNRASAIIRDEGPMANRNAIETVDCTFRDMLGVNLPFPGKVLIFGGDF